MEHIDEKIKKAAIGVNLMRKLNRSVFKCFIRSNLSYQTDKTESVQYNGALAITGAIKGTSKEKMYQKLGFETLKDRR